MPLPALAIQQPNIGGALMQGMQIRGAMAKNRLYERQMAREDELSGLRGQLITGDGGGMSLDPSVARQMMGAGAGGEVKQIADFVRSLDEDKRKKLAGDVDLIGRLLGPVKQAQNPLQAENLFQQAREMYGQGGGNLANVPENYDPQWVDMAMSRAMSISEGLKTAPPPQYDAPQFDKEVGKFYQVNPKTGKREYTSPQTGMDVTLPDGTVIRTGVKRDGTPGGMQKKTVGTIEQKLFDAHESLARLADVQRGFKPEYQTWLTRGSAWWTGIKEKAGRDVSPEERVQLTEFSKYKRKALENINLGIKTMTGAQMSNSEAGRIRKGMPDPGEGVFGGNSPTEFKAKLDDTIRSMRAASARYVHALRNGLDPKKSGITLEGIQRIMRSRQTEIIQDVRAGNPQITDEALRSILQQRLGAEFGLVF